MCERERKRDRENDVRRFQRKRVISQTVSSAAMLSVILCKT